MIVASGRRNPIAASAGGIPGKISGASFPKKRSPQLANLLRDRDRQVRIHRGAHSGKDGSRGRAFAVGAAWRSRSRWFANSPPTFLRQIGPDAEHAVPALVERLRDDSASVRDAAAFAIREIGTKDPTAIAGLAELLRDRDRKIRATAALTLERIGRRGRALPFGTAERSRSQSPRTERQRVAIHRAEGGSRRARFNRTAAGRRRFGPHCRRLRLAGNRHPRTISHLRAGGIAAR